MQINERRVLRGRVKSSNGGEDSAERRITVRGVVPIVKAWAEKNVYDEKKKKKEKKEKEYKIRKSEEGKGRMLE